MIPSMRLPSLLSRPSPTIRLALGLVGLCVSVFILADMLFGLLADPEGTAREVRGRLTETVTVQVSQALQHGDAEALGQLLDGVREHNADMLSVGVRTSGGRLVASSGAHPSGWADADVARSSTQRVIVPIEAGSGTWGRVEFNFAPVQAPGWQGAVRDKRLWAAVLVPLAALMLMYFYLQRALAHLNPLSVVPERLRAAFDGLTEGVVLVDAKGLIVLANRSLRAMAGVEGEAIHGRRIEGATWLQLEEGRVEAPWHEVLRTGQPVLDVRVHLGAGEARRIGSMNCAPIRDPAGRVRGCMTTLDDLSATERTNHDLRDALDKVERQRNQIKLQNEELIVLATRDTLTGLLNRRAFFERANKVLERQSAKTTGVVGVVMIDVDHFKKFNDTWGHAVGDVVLQQVAQQLVGSLRLSDLIARYGGEEFCVLLEATDAYAVRETAERVRRNIERNAGAQVEASEPLTVTASLGLITGTGAGLDLVQMLRAADEALYEAKRNGRNRVVVVADAQTPAEAAPVDVALDLG